MASNYTYSLISRTCECYFIKLKRLCRYDYVKNLQIGDYPGLFKKVLNAITKAIACLKREAEEDLTADEGKAR